MVDPCTPRGYERTADVNTRHSATISTATHTAVSTVISSGNFSECRTAAQLLLKQGHGNEFPAYMSSNASFMQLLLCHLTFMGISMLKCCSTLLFWVSDFILDVKLISIPEPVT